MIGLFLESLSLGWHAFIAIGVGFLSGLHPRIKRPARIGSILAAASFVAVVCCFFVFPLIGFVLLGSCREPAGQIAVNANIAFVVLSATIAVVGVGMLLAAIWRTNRKLLAFGLLVAAGFAMVLFVYLATFGVIFSAAGCFL